MPAPDEFDRIINGMAAVNAPQEHIDHTPYGAQYAPKAGLTKRGKAAIAIGATVIAGGSLIGYQSYSAQAAENEAKAQEIALQAGALELAKLKEINRANEASKTTQTSEEKARQTSVNACVKGKEHLVGKGFGSPSYRDLVDVCQDQYTGSAGGDDLQTAASSRQASSDGSGGVNDGALIGGGALVLVLLFAAKKGKQSSQA
ncbi:hypothetical protein AB0D12_31745 [Streptomyces sp. NPDC048479]|uniref:hypothetical protein n=1 Tax=Streptomyces sp. NPDC048479 TaxID=3154725 RepID=UPI003446A068